MTDNELNELNRKWLRKNSGLFDCIDGGLIDFCDYTETKKKILEMQVSIEELEQQRRELDKRAFQLETELKEYAECIDALVDNGSITHHPNIEMDALTDGMRAVAKGLNQ